MYTMSGRRPKAEVSVSAPLGGSLILGASLGLAPTFCHDIATVKIPGYMLKTKQLVLNVTAEEMVACLDMA